MGYNRSGGRRWGPGSAEALARYASSSGGASIAVWELGSGLDIKGHAKNFAPAMVAEDFATLTAPNASSSNGGGGGGGRAPMLLGSDPTSPGVYLP